MPMKLLRLTSAVDGRVVLVNPKQIKAIYKYYGRETTVVDYSGTVDGYAEVEESVEEIEKMLEAIEI